MRTLICPKCGKEKDKSAFIENTCAECYVSEHNLIELKNREIMLCKICGRIKRRYKWETFSEDELAGFIKSELKVHLDIYKVEDINIFFNKKSLKAEITLNGNKDGHEMNIKQKFIIGIKSRICDDCYKNISDYYNSIIQIRFDLEIRERIESDLKTKDLKNYFVKMMEKVVKEEKKEGNFAANTLKVDTMKNGFDFYVGSKNQSRAFIKGLKPLFKMEKKESKTLIGMDKRGKEKLRFTYLIRIV